MKRKYLILFSLCGLVLSFDQLTKYIAKNLIGSENAFEILPGFMRFVNIENNGFAFGLLKKAPNHLQDIFFIAVPIFALILILLIFIKLRDGQMLTSLALTCILGGAVGNLLDRLKFGFVIDFLDIHYKDTYHLPPLNVADISIVVGVAMMFYGTIKQTQEEQKA